MCTDMDGELRKAVVSYKRAAAIGGWSAHLELGEMYRNGEGTAVDVKRAIHHFEIHAKYETDVAHWHLACVYESEQGFIDKNRAMYHFRVASVLGNQEARGKVGDYFVSVAGPRKLSITNDDLQVFLHQIKSHFSQINNCTRNILAPQGYTIADTLDCTLPSQPPEFADVVLPAPVVPRSSSRFFEILSLAYPHPWVIPFSLLFGIFIGTLISYFVYRSTI